MKKIISIIIATCLAATLIVVPAAASLETDIQQFILTKDTAHQMADCARALGFAEDHIIIQTAKQEWNKAHEQQMKCQEELNKQKNPNTPSTSWTGSKLTKRAGVNYGPQGKETWYNLPMSGVVSIMRNMGYDATNYPYWIREDGCKMLGPYIMVGANFNCFPRGTVVECSLGMALVCDTGYISGSHLDIAVNW